MCTCLSQPKRILDQQELSSTAIKVYFQDVSTLKKIYVFKNLKEYCIKYKHQNSRAEHVTHIHIHFFSPTQITLHLTLSSYQTLF